MNAQNMQFLFESLIQTMYGGFEEQERPDTDTIFRFLNLSVDRYLKEKYLSQSTFKDNIEFVQKNSDDLRGLIKRQTGLVKNPLSGIPNRSLVNLPSDYLFYIKSESKVTRTALPVLAVAAWVPNREVTYKELAKITTSVYNTPILRHPVVTFEEDDKILLYKDNYTTVSDFEITYIREPKDLVLTVVDASTETTTVELAEHTHEEIVRLAVEMFTMEYKFRLQMKQPTTGEAK